MTKILVWMPLPESANWRGEGIAQAVESIIKNSDSEIQYEIYTSKNAGREIDSSLKQYNSKANVKLLNNKRKKSDFENLDLENLSKINLYRILLSSADNIIRRNKLYRLSELILIQIKGIFNFFLYSRLKNYSCIWVPSPAISIPFKTKSKVVYNFWDPFVFEYPFFNFFTKLFFYRRLSAIRNTGASIITQSNYNKSYLVNVLGFDSCKINVIRLGFHIPSHDYIKDKENSITLDQFPKRLIKKTQSLPDYAIYVKDFDNKSVISRLEKRITKNTKIIFVSTQKRPYKGIETFLFIFEALVKNYDIVLLTTTDIAENIIDRHPTLTESTFVLSRVTDAQHSYLMQISDLIIHPSYVEGGQGAFPLFEANSFNKPALINWGRHVEEFKEWSIDNLDLSLFAVNFDRFDVACNKILELIYDEKYIQDNISAVRKLTHSWSTTSHNYINLFKNV